MSDPTDKKELKYPVVWEFRAVVESEKIDAAEEFLHEILVDEELRTELNFGLNSSGGRYRTIKFALELRDREFAAHLEQRLLQMPGLKFLL